MLLMFSGILLLPLVAKGNKETDCAAMDEKHLQCNFPENINRTRKDFAVYFLPETGGEEKVVDCVWINELLHCIRQEGFECQQPVSDKAVIGVSTRFLNRTGSYRCNMNGYRPDKTLTCRFPDKKDKEVFAVCEAEGIEEKSKVTLNCKLPSTVETFSIQQNNTVVARLKISDCQSPTVCGTQPGDSYDMLKVKLNVEGFTHCEYMCHPDSSSLHLQIKRCSVYTENTEQTEESTFPLVAVILSVICGLTLVAAATVVLFIRKHQLKRRRQREAGDRQEREPL